MAKFRAQRWLGVFLRSLHLAAVILLGARLLGAPLPAGWPAIALPLAVLMTGGALLALDLWSHHDHFFEAAGASVAAKLLLVGWMTIDPGLQLPLFWSIVLWSAIFSHAPASVRHRRLWPRKPETTADRPTAGAPP